MHLDRSGLTNQLLDAAIKRFVDQDWGRGRQAERELPRGEGGDERGG
jgi:hypothetical protein